MVSWPLLINADPRPDYPRWPVRLHSLPLCCSIGRVSLSLPSHRPGTVGLSQGLGSPPLARIAGSVTEIAHHGLDALDLDLGPFVLTTRLALDPFGLTQRPVGVGKT
jgi:hypothetical protein